MRGASRLALLHETLIAFICVSAVFAASSLDAAEPRSYPEARRVVAVGGSVTEIVYALGQQSRLVARDSTSTWPVKALDLPDVGYMRALSAEGVLSVDPDLIIAEEGSGPPEAVDLLSSAGIPYAQVPDGYDAPGVLSKVEAVAQLLGVPEAGALLADTMRAQFAAASAAADAVTKPKRVLFILSMQGGRIMAAGQGTAADGIITMAGARNAIDGFTGYKPMTDEAVSAAAPDVILMMDRSGDHSFGDDVEVLGHPAISVTPAAASGALVRMDGLLLLGFGPRTPQAVRDLNAALYPGAG